MSKPPSIALGTAGIVPDAPFDPAAHTLKLGSMRRRELTDFTDDELKSELLDRGVTDFSRVTPWLKCALLLVIVLLLLMTNIGMQCMDGELSGFACTIAQ